MKNLREIFQKIDFPNPPEELGGRVLRAIKIHQRIEFGRTRFVTRLGRIASLGGMVMAIIFFGHTIITSEFWSLFALLFSDADIVMRYFGEFSFSLLETVPALPITIILVPVFSFLVFQFWSLSLDMNEGKSHLLLQS